MIVLDANILVRAVLGKRVRNLLAHYSDKVRFLVPEAVLGEVDASLPIIYSRRALSSAGAAWLCSHNFNPGSCQAPGTHTLP